MIDLLKTNGKFYKANLHCHTTLSDGKMTPLQVKEYYLKNGYSIVAFTDHSKYAWYPELLSEDFIPVAGFEAAWTCLDPDTPPLKFKLCHINFLAGDPESFIDVACMQHRVLLPDGTIEKCKDNMCPKEWFDYLLSKGIMPLMPPSLKEFSLYDLAFSYGSRIVNHDNPEKMIEHLNGNA